MQYNESPEPSVCFLPFCYPWWKSLKWRNMHSKLFLFAIGSMHQSKFKHVVAFLYKKWQVRNSICLVLNFNISWHFIHFWYKKLLMSRNYIYKLWNSDSVPCMFAIWSLNILNSLWMFASLKETDEGTISPWLLVTSLLLTTLLYYVSQGCVPLLSRAERLKLPGKKPVLSEWPVLVIRSATSTHQHCFALMDIVLKYKTEKNSLK